MRKQLKAMEVAITVSMFMVIIIFLPAQLNAGSLEPSGPPGPTMHTLDEIYNKLETINNKIGACVETKVPKTGQTVSYAAEDDGELEKGVAWPDPRFTDHADGTVTDNLTGLMWTKNANIYESRTWEDALSDCAGCTEGNYSDWRLPNLRELQSLIDYGQYSPALPLGHPFSNVHLYFYWSSTAYTHRPDYIWGLYLSDALIYTYRKDSEYYVWCVRGGQ